VRLLGAVGGWVHRLIAIDYVLYSHATQSDCGELLLNLMVSAQMFWLVTGRVQRAEVRRIMVGDERQSYINPIDDIPTETQGES